MVDEPIGRIFVLAEAQVVHAVEVAWHSCKDKIHCILVAFLPIVAISRTVLLVVDADGRLGIVSTASEEVKFMVTGTSDLIELIWLNQIGPCAFSNDISAIAEFRIGDGVWLRVLTSIIQNLPVSFWSSGIVFARP